MENFATVEDVMNLYGPLNADQIAKVEQLLSYTSSYFRTLAKEYGRDLNQEVIDDEDMKNNAKLALNVSYVYHFKTSNKTHTMKVIDIESLQSELNTLRAHECPKPTAKAISVVTKEVVKYVNKSYIVTFAKNSSELNLRAKNDLDMIPTNVTVNIEASASPEGSVDHNLKLSQDRANSVKEYLESRGIQVRNADGVGVYDDASGRQAIITIL